MSRILFVVNRARGVKPDQTTALLFECAAMRGHQVWVVGVGHLGMEPDGGVTAQALRVEAGRDRERMIELLNDTDFERVRLDQTDAVVIRTNPARDGRRWAHDAALSLLSRAAARGVLVLNDPDGLRRASSKLYLMDLPERVRPRTLVSRDAEVIAAFVADHGGAVIKPLSGTQGRDVFHLRPGGDNHRQIIDVVTRVGFAMVQEYVKEAVDGDVRLIMLDGEPLTLKGKIAAVNRTPPAGDFRSNVAVGGRAQPVSPTKAQLDNAKIIGQQLRADGLWLAGLDLIGDKAVEVNVFATGGVKDAERFTGQRFTEALLVALEGKL